VKAALPPEAKGKPLEVWFQDEARVGQKGTLVYIWGEKSKRPRDQRYDCAYITCARTRSPTDALRITTPLFRHAASHGMTSSPCRKQSNQSQAASGSSVSNHRAVGINHTLITNDGNLRKVAGEFGGRSRKYRTLSSRLAKNGRRFSRE